MDRKDEEAVQRNCSKAEDWLKSSRQALAPTWGLIVSYYPMALAPEVVSSRRALAPTWKKTFASFRKALAPEFLFSAFGL